MGCNQRTFGRRPICEVDGQSWLEAAHALSSGSAGYSYFVDPLHPAASLNNDGRDMDNPLPTITSALGKCRAYRNDQVLVSMNSYWTYSSPIAGRYAAITENVVVGVPGVRIVGLSPSSSMGVPWTPAANFENLIEIEAMDVTIEGFLFWPDTYTNSLGIMATWDGPPWGENCVIRNCYFFGLDYGVVLDYTYHVIVENCRFENIDEWAIFNSAVHGEPDNAIIRNCYFVNCDGGIELPDCVYELIHDCDFIDCNLGIRSLNGEDSTIRDCSFNGDPTGANNFINLTGGATNLVTGCKFSCTIAQYDTTCSDATSGSWVDNWCTDGSPVAPPT